MFRICEIPQHFGLEEFLQPALSPIVVCKAENCLGFGCPVWLPFSDQLSMQFFKFFWIFSWRNRHSGKYAVFESIGRFLWLGSSASFD